MRAAARTDDACALHSRLRRPSQLRERFVAASFYCEPDQVQTATQYGNNAVEGLIQILEYFPDKLKVNDITPEQKRFVLAALDSVSRNIDSFLSLMPADEVGLTLTLTLTLTLALPLPLTLTLTLSLTLALTRHAPRAHAAGRDAAVPPLRPALLPRHRPRAQRRRRELRCAPCPVWYPKGRASRGAGDALPCA